MKKLISKIKENKVAKVVVGWVGYLVGVVMIGVLVKVTVILFNLGYNLF